MTKYIPNNTQKIITLFILGLYYMQIITSFFYFRSCSYCIVYSYYGYLDVNNILQFLGTLCTPHLLHVLFYLVSPPCTARIYETLKNLSGPHIAWHKKQFQFPVPPHLTNKKWWKFTVEYHMLEYLFCTCVQVSIHSSFLSWAALNTSLKISKWSLGLLSRVCFYR